MKRNVDYDIHMYENMENKCYHVLLLLSFAHIYTKDMSYEQITVKTLKTKKNIQKRFSCSECWKKRQKCIKDQ